MDTIKDSWEKLQGQRSAMLERSRDCAELTLPYVLPPEGYDGTGGLPTPYQSLGARGVNNLTSKMLLALFPTNTAFFRFSLNPELVKQLTEETGAESAQIKGALEDALRLRENQLLRRLETGNLRATLGSIFKHLIVAGNTMLYLPKKGLSRMYALDQYAVKRDPMGTVTKLVIKEKVHPSTLDEKVTKVCQVVTDGRDNTEMCEVYTCMMLTESGGYEWHQEINNIEVPGSKGSSPKGETPPYLPLRWQAVSGNDYGIGLVEEYLGDLRSLEGLMKSVIGFSAAAAKIVIMLHPNSSTDEDSLATAESGDIVEGTMQDIDVLQLDKYADFKVAKTVMDDLTMRLSHAFLLQSGTVRDAERVTAAEISAMAQELEDVLGGVYTVMSQELQLPLVKRLISSEKAAGKFPKLPKVKGEDSVDPVIVTGFDALGRGHELNKLRGFIQDLTGMIGEQALGLIDPSKIAKRLGHGHNIDVSDFLKSEDQMQQEQQAAQQQQMQQTLLEKGTAPAVSGMAQGMNQQQTQ